MDDFEHCGRGSYVVIYNPSDTSFITRVTGSPIRSGIVMAIIGLAALTGPWIGRFADKHRMHRRIYLLSLLGLSAAFMILAMDSQISHYTPIAGLLLGTSLAAQGTIGPAFIVGKGEQGQLTARKLTVYGLLFPVGQVAGAMAVVAGLLLGGTEQELFWIAAAVLMLLALIVWPTLGEVTVGERKHKSAQKGGNVRPHIVMSVFGLFLFAATLGAIANNGLFSQAANLLPAVYGFSKAQTALLVGLAGLASIGATLLAGRMMARRGSYNAYLNGSVIKWIGMSGMMLAALFSGPYLLFAGLMVLIAYSGPQITKLASPDVSARLAPVPATEANGYYFATSALGAFLGSLAAGALAEFVSYSSINIMNAALSGLAVLVMVIFLSRKVHRVLQ